MRKADIAELASELMREADLAIAVLLAARTDHEIHMQGSGWRMSGDLPLKMELCLGRITRARNLIQQGLEEVQSANEDEAP